MARGQGWLPPGRGRWRQLAFAVTVCAPLQGAAAVISNYSADDVKRWEAACVEITECFCILDTRCGWCETTNSATLGTSGGPRAGFCPNWIHHAYDCNLLYCNAHDNLYGWMLELYLFPLMVVLLWAFALQWQKRAQLKYLADNAQLPPGLRKRPGNPRQATFNMELTRMDTRPLVIEGSNAVCPADVDLESLPEFFRFKRTYFAFRKGLDCPKEERVPNNERTYQLNLDHFEKRFSKKAVIRMACHAQLALGQTLQSAASLMLLSSLYVTVLRTSARNLTADGYNQIAMATHEMGAVVTTLQMAVNMLLSFYVLNRIAWLWSVQQEGYKLQGRAHDVAMLAGTKARSTEKDWRDFYVLYRYMMLAFFFAYKNFVPQLRETGTLELRACGLLTAEEAALVEKHHRFPGTIVEAWLARWISDHLEGEIQNQTLYALREYRGCMASVSDWLHQRAPVSFESLLYSAVYALCFVMPFGPSHIDYNDRYSVMTSSHIAPVLGCTVVSSFYLALVNFLRTIQQPFGNSYPAGPDALHAEFILLTTERKLRDYLSTDYPSGKPEM